MRIPARHHWIDGATITESVSEDGRTRRFTATIRGFRNWRIYEGSDWNARKIIDKVSEIRGRIAANDETVLKKPDTGRQTNGLPTPSL